MQHDPLNDALVLIKNAASTGKLECTVRPSSQLIASVLRVMQDNHYISRFEFVEDGKAGLFKVALNGNINNCGVIKPRYAVKKVELEKWESRFLPAQDFGVLILTTTAGVVTHAQAREKGVGGKLLAFVY